jgi:hypothetical protein
VLAKDNQFLYLFFLGTTCKRKCKKYAECKNGKSRCKKGFYKSRRDFILLKKYNLWPTNHIKRAFIDMHYWANTIFKNKYHTKILIIYFILSGYCFHRRKIDASDLPKGGIWVLRFFIYHTKSILTFTRTTSRFVESFLTYKQNLVQLNMEICIGISRTAF